MKKAKKFSSVWDAIEDSAVEAESMKIKSELMIAVRDRVEKMKLTQANAAKQLGITQPRLNDLLRGRIDKFSLEALLDLGCAAGLKIHMHLKAA